VLVLAGLAALGALAGLPLSLDLARTDPAISAGLPQTPAAYYLLGLSLGLQSFVLYGVMILAGLAMGRRLGLGAPVLDALTRGRGLSAEAKRHMLRAAAAGILLGFALVALDRLFFLDRLPPALTADASPLATRLLAGLLYGGINEELMWRLFAVTLLVFLGAAAWQRAKTVPAAGVLWAAIGLAALGFAALHLPATAALTELTPLVVTRAMVLNTIAGLLFGWLYTRFGIEAAMAAHMGAHLPLQMAAGY
jgi:hypothetical protein